MDPITVLTGLQLLNELLKQAGTVSGVLSKASSEGRTTLTDEEFQTFVTARRAAMDSFAQTIKDMEAGK